MSLRWATRGPWASFSFIVFFFFFFFCFFFPCIFALCMCQYCRFLFCSSLYCFVALGCEVKFVPPWSMPCYCVCFVLTCSVIILPVVEISNRLARLVVYFISRNVRKRTFIHVRPAKIQISLRIRAVWSESSLGSFGIAMDERFLLADNKNSDKTSRKHRMIWVFVDRSCRRYVFSCLTVNFLVRRRFLLVSEDDRDLWLSPKLLLRCNKIMLFAETFFMIGMQIKIILAVMSGMVSSGMRKCTHLHSSHACVKSDPGICSALIIL